MMNKSQADRHARKHGEHNLARRRRSKQLRKFQRRTPVETRIIHAPKPVEIPKLSSEKPGIFKRMFRRMRGGK